MSVKNQENILGRLIARIEQLEADYVKARKETYSFDKRREIRGEKREINKKISEVKKEIETSKKKE